MAPVTISRSSKRYRVVARLYLLPGSIGAPYPLWVAGVYALGRNITTTIPRPAVCYNAKNTAAFGEGFHYMASHNGTQDVARTKIPNTGAMSEERWTLMSVMVDMTDEDPSNWELAVCADVNGDGILDEDDPREYVSTRLTPTAIPGPPGIFVSGAVFSNQHPLYVDWV